jgi:hypothetical protein
VRRVAKATIAQADRTTDLPRVDIGQVTLDAGISSLVRTGGPRGNVAGDRASALRLQPWVFMTRGPSDLSREAATMPTAEQVQMRRHLSELRHAVGGIGHDFSLEFKDLDEKIDRLGQLTAYEAKAAVLGIQDDFARVGKAIDREMERLPGQVARGLSSAGIAIGHGTVVATQATKDALLGAGHKAKEGTKNELATLAGVKRTPIKEWKHPSEGESE